MVLITTQPYDYEIPPEGHLALIIIDIQRDFMEPGGFGDALGNDVSLLQAIMPTLKTLLETFRSQGLPVFHTIECHRPDFSDCPPSKLQQGREGLKMAIAGRWVAF